jgi:hypothetical protein
MSRYRSDLQMSSRFDLQSINLPTIADGLTAILFSPVILPIAEAVKQPLVQSTIKEGIAISERYQNAMSEIAESWEKATNTSQKPRETISSQSHLKNGKSDAAKNFVHSISELNAELSRMTNGAADLRVILPVGLGLFAIRQLIRQGWKLDEIPWYILAWYAVDTFVKLNSEEESQESQLVNVSSTTFSVTLQEQQNSDSSNTYKG